MSTRKSKKDPITSCFVLKTECEERMRRGNEEFTEIKQALVGKEFGKLGGLVKDIADIKQQIGSMQSEMQTQNKRRWSPREKALIMAALITGISSIATAVISIIH